MKRIAQYFIDNSFLVNLLSAIMVIVGLMSLSSMKRDLISGWESKRIQVNATLTGAGPAQVERFITYPIERAIRNTPGIENIYSSSSQGYMNLNVHLKDEVDDIAEIETKIKDSIENIKGDLPQGVEDIRVRHRKQTKAWFNYYAILNFDTSSDTHQDWLLRMKEEISREKGVADIDSYGAVKSLFVKLKPDALARYRVKPSDIYQRIIETFRIYPLGSITKGADTYSLEIQNKEFNLDEIREIPIRTNKSLHTLKLSELAQLEVRLPKQNRESFTNGKKAISFNVYKEIEADSIALKDRLEKRIEKINKSAPKGLEIISVEDGPAFIERQINALKSNALFGVVLVIVTLCLFLGFKNAIMTSFGLPLAYLFTFTVLENLGISIDLISVVGMLLVIGIVVDDAIIVSEQYMQNLERGDSPRDAATNAVLKTWKPICGTVATTLIAFTPILLGKDSMSGILIAIPIVVFSALGLSLFESFFILPNHLSHFVKKAKTHEESKLFLNFKSKYERLLKFSLRWRYFVVAVFASAMIASIMFASKNMNMNFNLNISSESVEFIGELKDSNSISDSKAKLQVIDEAVASIDKEKYKNYQMDIGSNWTNGERKIGPQYFSYWISFSQLDPNVEKNKKEVEKYLKNKVEEIKKSGLFERLEVKIRKGGRDENREDIVEVTMRSLNPFNADQLTKSVKSEIEKLDIKGIKSVDLDDSLFKDAWVFVPNIAEIHSRGLSLRQISSQLVQYIRKNEVYEYNLGSRSMKFYTYFEDGEELSFKDLSKLPVILTNGQKIPSSELGEWKKEKRQARIKHSNLMRRVTIDLPFDKDIIKKEVLIKEIASLNKELSKKYPDITFNAKDADEQSRKNKASMFKKFTYALIGIFFVLAIILRSLIQPLLICSAIPFGIIGVIWAFHFQGLEISLMAIIGIIGMAGVVVNDSLLLVVTINEKRKDWFSFHSPEIISGASSRLRAIVLTSITTLGGVFPMAYAIGGDAGFTKSLAMSMGWGLLFATLLTLIVLPCMLLMQRDFMYFFNRKILRRKFSVEDDDFHAKGKLFRDHTPKEQIKEDSITH